jgi:hypothetical protein
MESLMAQELIQFCLFFLFCRCNIDMSTLIDMDTEGVFILLYLRGF